MVPARRDYDHILSLAAAHECEGPEGIPCCKIVGDWNCGTVSLIRRILHALAGAGAWDGLGDRGIAGLCSATLGNLGSLLPLAAGRSLQGTVPWMQL